MAVIQPFGLAAAQTEKRGVKCAGNGRRNWFRLARADENEHSQSGSTSMKSAKEQDSRFPLATPSSVNDDAANQRKESDPKVNWWEQKKPSTYGHTCDQDTDTGPNWMEPSDVTPPGRTDQSGEGDCDMWGK